jgi:hypothetical protein
MPPTVGPVKRDQNELRVSLGALNASDSLAVSEFMPQLVEDLQPEWPVTGYHFRKRNPYKPEGTETAVVLHLLSPLLTELGNRLRDIVLEKTRLFLDEIHLLLKGKRRRTPRPKLRQALKPGRRRSAKSSAGKRLRPKRRRTVKRRGGK